MLCFSFLGKVIWGLGLVAFLALWVAMIYALKDNVQRGNGLPFFGLPKRRRDKHTHSVVQGNVLKIELDGGKAKSVSVSDDGKTVSIELDKE